MAPLKRVSEGKESRIRFFISSFIGFPVRFRHLIEDSSTWVVGHSKLSMRLSDKSTVTNRVQAAISLQSDVWSPDSLFREAYILSKCLREDKPASDSSAFSETSRILKSVQKSNCLRVESLFP
jgi:hypothetical protein